MKVIIIKKRYIQIAIVLILIALIFVYKIHHNSKTMAVTYLPISNKVIAIDAGHGGVDPGAVSKNGVKESDINLKIAIKLKRLIEQSGGIVIMTRTKDEGLHSSEAKTLRKMKTEDLHKRKEIIQMGESELFISIHLNSFTRPNYYGAQTFYKKDFKEGEKLALLIQKEFKNILDNENNRQPQKRDDVFLLNEIDVPAVLVECGFLSNSNEEKLLQEELYQEKIAWCIYIGIMNYFSGTDNE